MALRYCLSALCLTILTTSKTFLQHRSFNQEQHRTTIHLGIYLYFQPQQLAHHCSRHSDSPRPSASTLRPLHSEAHSGLISNLPLSSTIFAAHISFPAPLGDAYTRAWPSFSLLLDAASIAFLMIPGAQFSTGIPRF